MQGEIESNMRHGDENQEYSDFFKRRKGVPKQTKHNSLEAQSVVIVQSTMRGKKRSRSEDDAEHGYCCPSKHQIVVEKSEED